MKSPPLFLPPIVLRLNDLRPGDVLLSLSRGKVSEYIRFFSRGEFSHSALCTSPYTIFESDGENVIGNKILKLVGYLQTPAETSPLGKIPGEVATCAVYRHPKMSSISPDRFSAALKKTMLRFYGRDYSYMIRLAPLARTNRFFKWGVELYCKYQDRKMAADALPSVFCSELIGHFYEEVGLTLFSEDKRPEDISPSDLAQSQLEVVQEVVLESANLRGIAPAMEHKNALFTAYETHDPLASYNKWALVSKANVEKLEQFGKTVQSQTLEALKANFINVDDSMTRLKDHLDQCVETRNAGCMRRAHELTVRWTRLADEVPNLVIYAGNNQFAEFSSLLRARSLAERSLARCEIMLMTHRLKMLQQRSTGWKHYRVRRVRRKILRNGREMTQSDVARQRIVDSFAKGSGRDQS